MADEFSSPRGGRACADAPNRDPSDRLRRRAIGGPSIAPTILLAPLAAGRAAATTVVPAGKDPLIGSDAVPLATTEPVIVRRRDGGLRGI